jgi:hypothetical protein
MRGDNSAIDAMRYGALLLRRRHRRYKTLSVICKWGKPNPRYLAELERLEEERHAMIGNFHREWEVMAMELESTVERYDKWCMNRNDVVFTVRFAAPLPGVFVK